MLVFHNAPASLKYTDFGLSSSDTVARAQSVYTGHISRIDFGGEWWSLSVSTPVLTETQASEIIGWSDILRDSNAVARLPLLTQRFGDSTASAIVAYESASSGARSFTVSGIGAGKTIGAGTLLTDQENRLYRVRVSAQANGAGRAAINLFPRLRVPALVGDSFRVVENRGIAGNWILGDRPQRQKAPGQYGGAVGAIQLEFSEAFV